MKKILNKKVLGVLLAVMMLFSLSAPAFADTPTATIVFYVDDEYYFEYDVELTATTTIYDAIEANEDLEAVWETVGAYNQQGQPVAAKALVSLMGFGNYPMTGDDYMGIDTVQAWSLYNPGYGLVLQPAQNSGLYKFIYSGYDWTYAVNGIDQVSFDMETMYYYPDQIVLSDGDLIEFNYHYICETWDRATPIISQYPFI